MKPPVISLAFALFIAAVVTFHPGRTDAQTLVNGDFENPQTSTSNIGAGPGWTYSGDVWYGPYNNPHDQAFGSQAVTLEGIYGGGAFYSVTPAVISQTVSTDFSLGSQYELVLYAFASGYATVDAYLNVNISGGATAAVTSSLPPLIRNPYTPVTYTRVALDFVVTSSSPVTFTMTVPVKNDVVSIDNIQIVPEPRTWLALTIGGGVAIIAGVRRRRSV